MEKALGELVKGMKDFEIPSAPGFITELPKPEDNLISLEDQRTYQIGISMNMYLTKHSIQDIANATRK